MRTILSVRAESVRLVSPLPIDGVEAGVHVSIERPADPLEIGAEGREFERVDTRHKSIAGIRGERGPR